MLYVNQVYIGGVIMLSLHNVMRANAMSCMVFGGVFALLPGQVAVFLGGASPAPRVYILALGVMLIINGIHLVWASRRARPKKQLILYFSLGDFLWVIASGGLMLLGVWITSPAGVIATSAVAVMVGLFGILQLTGIKAVNAV